MPPSGLLLDHPDHSLSYQMVLVLCREDIIIWDCFYLLVGLWDWCRHFECRTSVRLPELGFWYSQFNRCEQVSMPQFPPLKSGIIISPTSQDLGRITLVDIFPGGSDSKESVCNVGDPGLILGRIPGEENGNPLQNSCQEKSHGWRSLLGYSPWSHKESDMTEWLAYTLANGLPRWHRW